MTATRPPSREDQQRMLADEQAKMRRIGVIAIGVILAVVVIGFFGLRGSQEDQPDVLIVFGQGASISLDEDDVIRVEGTMRRAVDDDRYNDTSTVSLFADDIKLSQSGDPSSGLTKIADLRGARDRVGDKVTVVGRVESVSANDRVIAIAEP